VVYTPPTGAIAIQWFTRVNYMTDLPLDYLPGGIIVTKDVFNSIPPTFQNIITEASQRHLDQLKRVTRNDNQEAIKVMMKQGVKMVTPQKTTLRNLKRYLIRPSAVLQGPPFLKSS